jgi:hypothetical protein
MSTTFLTHNQDSTLVRGRPRHESKVVNGVAFTVTRTEQGSTVQSDCHCMGSILCATHTNPRCPMMPRAKWGF